MNSKSEAIRARMVEFFSADAKVSPVAVHIDARQAVTSTNNWNTSKAKSEVAAEGKGVWRHPTGWLATWRGTRWC
jgi:hypothetical protein